MRTIIGLLLAFGLPIIAALITMREPRTWYNRMALIGLFLFEIFLILKIQHYPLQKETSIACIVCLSVATVANIVAILRKKATAFASFIKLGLYTFLALILINSFIQRKSTSINFIIKKDPKFQHLIDSIQRETDSGNAHQSLVI